MPPPSCFSARPNPRLAITDSTRQYGTGQVTQGFGPGAAHVLAVDNRFSVLSENPPASTHCPTLAVYESTGRVSTAQHVSGAPLIFVV